MKSSGRPMVHVGKPKSSSNSCFLSVAERMCLGSSLTSFRSARSDTKARRASLATVAALLLTAAGARAEEHVSGFANLSEPQSTTPLEDWGPVPTDKASIANLAPCLLPFFNNGPVFGLPGTVTGDFWDQTQLTGDWDGVRTEMTRRGLFIDLYSTSALSGCHVGWAQDRDRISAEHATFRQPGYWPRGTMAWRSFPFHCAVPLRRQS